ncbi:hypothetical protein GWI33_005150 [Rhynchophorus ferrugineus]|uniref:Uncharacterized protein n=1 Tax=Rhynchophorus ferrugineus TaxID=354439 RepID=A0A834IKZ6_RHYFE|nr:hypothetical protein GWI33_005150 [Rhynchophorus ferrugineus]
MGKTILESTLGVAADIIGEKEGRTYPDVAQNEAHPSPGEPNGKKRLLAATVVSAILYTSPIWTEGPT